MEYGGSLRSELDAFVFCTVAQCDVNYNICVLNLIPIRYLFKSNFSS